MGCQPSSSQGAEEDRGHQATSLGLQAVVPAAALAAQPPSLYQLLELSPEASAEQVRSAFRSLSKRFHPDTTTLPQEEAGRRFRQLQEAMAVLGDPEQRRRYDAQLRAQALNRQAIQRAQVQANAWRPNTDPPVRRPLSGGEWFALLLLALALGFSLVLGLGMAWWRGLELVETGAPQHWLQSWQERLMPAPQPEPLPPAELSLEPEQPSAPALPT